MRRSSGVVLGALVALGLMAGPALACGGLVAPNGSVNLLRTSTLAAYHDGVEHYVTSFEFAGGGARFGSIVPLPGIPTRVIKGGDWTLQRLAIETQPQPERRVLSFSAVAGAAADKAVVISRTRIEALDVTIVRGGGYAVGKWAKDQGFFLPPDAPEVLDFYARRSPIFMAASFDPKEASQRGLTEGDGTPVHLAIPTDDPWVPLRILGLGKQPDERVEADVYLLTDRRPAMLPDPEGAAGIDLRLSSPASEPLLADLRSDRGMGWLPASNMWLTYVGVDARAGDLNYDLAVDETGLGTPSLVDAGLEDVPVPPRAPDGSSLWVWVLAAVAGVVLFKAGDRFIART